MSCQYAHLDGAYVLGALAPAERLEFEAHLPSCAECSRGVRELAGLPGLLAQVDVADLEVPTPDAPLPQTLLPALVREVRGEQRRRSLLTAAVAAAVAAVFVSALAIGGVFDESTPTTTSAATPTASRPVAPVGEAMQPVGAGPVKAAVALTGVAWGTKLDLTCSYADVGSGDGEYEEGGGAGLRLGRAHPRGAHGAGGDVEGPAGQDHAADRGDRDRAHRHHHRGGPHRRRSSRAHPAGLSGWSESC